MNKKTAAALALLLLILSGCAETWVKPGGTTQEFAAMKAACLSRAAMRYPPIPVPITTTNCNTRGCFTITVVLDNNQGPRNQDTRSCFYENGWTPATASASAEETQPSATSADQSFGTPSQDLGQCLQQLPYINIDKCMKTRGHMRVLNCIGNHPQRFT